MRLQDKTALITGGSSGIGLATAKLFIAEGAKVAITGRNQTALDDAVKELGPNAIAIQADAADVAATERAVAEAAKTFGGLDIVFANAGIPGGTPLGQTTLEAFEEIIRINLTGVFFTVQAAVPVLRDGGSVILNGSVMAWIGAPGSSAYAASKAGVRSMARVMASELAPRRIRVNVISPGATRTPIWGKAPRPVSADEMEKRLAAMVPMGRLGEAEEIAKTALFLASDDASHIQAEEIIVDGGGVNAPLGAPAFRR